MSWFSSLKKEEKNIFFNLIFALLNLTFVAIFFRNIVYTSVLLAILTAIFFVYYRASIYIAVFIFGTVGAIAEMYCINQGVWNYALPNVSGVPFWLFILWGNAALFMYRTGVEFERLGLHK